MSLKNLVTHPTPNSNEGTIMINDNLPSWMEWVLFSIQPEFSFSILWFWKFGEFFKLFCKFLGTCTKNISKFFLKKLLPQCKKISPKRLLSHHWFKSWEAPSFLLLSNYVVMAHSCMSNILGPCEGCCIFNHLHCNFSFWSEINFWH